MFMNRLLFKEEIIEGNELSLVEQAQVFSVLKPLEGRGKKARFLECDADHVIGDVRRRAGRPPDAEGLSVPMEAPAMNTSVPLIDVVERFCDRLDDAIGRLLDRLGPAATPEPQRRVLTSEEAAEAMRLKNSQTVMRWCRQGRITGMKLGKKWLIPQESVDEYLRREILINGAERRK